MFYRTLLVMLCLGTSPITAFQIDQSDSRPNILLITTEDNSAFWLGSYGNAQARTPNLDRLANEGVLFRHCYSNAPVCAVARSTLLNGIYAVAQGTQHMRSRYPIPPENRPYVSYLREQGYYCTNSSKTDFNIKGDDKAVWDACSGKAHYKNRPADKPFFAVFNITDSHESSLFPERLKKSRQAGNIPEQPRIHPNGIDLPPHLPDLPEIRADMASYHDIMTFTDSRVGKLLDELEQSGLADNTIVIYFSDHGGPTPRGKRYLENTGVQVPLIVRVPDRWSTLSRFTNGTQTDELVSFVDFAPTFLSLVGRKAPAQMQGRAFLGEHRAEPPVEPVVFLFGDRFDEQYGMRRAITDGKFKYIRRFTAWLPAAPYSKYPLGQQGWSAWRDAAAKGSLQPYHQELWSDHQAVEQLFDLTADPWEVTNLADDRAHRQRLDTMRERLKQQMVDARDSGLVPEGLFEPLAGASPLASWLVENKFDFRAITDLAFATTSCASDSLDVIRKNLASADPVRRYWAIQGCLASIDAARDLETELLQRMREDVTVNQISAAHALCRAGIVSDAKQFLTTAAERLQSEVNALFLADVIRLAGLR